MTHYVKCKFGDRLLKQHKISTLLTVVIISCKNLNGGFDKSFSVSGGFLIILPSVSWVFFIIFGSNLPFAFSPMVVVYTMVYQITNLIVFFTTSTIN